MKIDKKSNMFKLLEEPGEDKLIPYIERFLIVHPYTGGYMVDDDEYVSDEKNRKNMHFHPSGDCLKCEKLLYYERDPSVELIPEVISPKLQFVFKTGKALHTMVQAWFETMGGMENQIGFVGNEVRIFDKERNIGGYVDSVVRLPGNDFDTPVEIKTINDYGFSSLSGPKAAHKLQLGVYIMETGAPFGILLYIDKNSQDMKEYKVEPFDLMNVMSKWQKVRAAVEGGDPSCLAGGCKCGDRTWERCPARDICYRM